MMRISWLAVTALALWVHCPAFGQETLQETAPESTEAVPTEAPKEESADAPPSESQYVQEVIRPASYFHDRNKLSEFIPYARDYLKSNPKDPQADRILMDMWLCADSLKDTTAVEEAQIRLLLEHPKSLSTKYLIQVIGVNKTQGLLTRRFSSTALPLKRVTIFRFYRAIEAHPEVLAKTKDVDLLAIYAIATPEEKMPNNVREWLKDSRTEQAQIARICCSNKLSNVKKFEQLEDFDSGIARAYRDYLFFEEFSDEDRNKRSLALLMLDQMLSLHQYDSSIPLIKKLREEVEEPRLIFWQGVSEASLGETSAALETLQQLRELFPTSEWAHASHRLSIAFSHLPQSIQDHKQIISRFLDRLKMLKYLAFSMDISEIGDNQASQVIFRIGCDLKENRFQVLLQDENATVAGFSLGAKDGEWFVAGDKKLHHYDTPGTLPTFNIQFTKSLFRHDLRQYFDFNIHTKGDGLSNSFDRLLEQSFLQSSELDSYMQVWLRCGYFPEEVETFAGNKTLRWISPRLHDATFTCSQIELSNDFYLQRLEIDSEYRIDFSQTASGEPFALSRQWPGYSIENSNDSGIVGLLKFWEMLDRYIFSDDKLSDQVASRTP